MLMFFVVKVFNFCHSRYQQCIEDANIDMTRDMIGHKDNHEMAFQTLCAGIDQVLTVLTHTSAKLNYIFVMAPFESTFVIEEI